MVPVDHLIKYAPALLDVARMPRVEEQHVFQRVHACANFANVLDEVIEVAQEKEYDPKKFRPCTNQAEHGTVLILDIEPVYGSILNTKA